MNTLTSAPYSLSLNTLIRAKVRAHNTNGYGSYSQPNIVGEVALTVPDIITDLAADPLTSDITDIDLIWSDPSNDGGSAILNFEIQWDQGIPTWTQLAVVAAGTNNLL